VKLSPVAAKLAATFGEYDLTEAEMFQIALYALDQSGLSMAAQHAVETLIAENMQHDAEWRRRLRRESLRRQAKG
jgi:hypothetical protein